MYFIQGWKFLRDLEKGKYAESDTYLTHEILPADRLEVLLITNQRILVMNYQQMLGTWSLDWQFLYSEINEPPSVGWVSFNFCFKVCVIYVMSYSCQKYSLSIHKHF